MPQSDAIALHDVLILGAGWSGLLACKYCLSEGLSVAVLESRDSIGGVWAFTEDTRYGGVMTTTEMTSSRCISEISDFPMPEHYPDFPKHSDVLDYLKAYCAEFGLERHIHLGQKVTKARKSDGTWLVTCADEREYRGRNLIVSSGVHQNVNDNSGEVRFREFTGQISHSAAVKQVPPDYSGKTIVIWGGGESASDIAVEIAKKAARVYWCIPNGQWFVPKTVEGWPPFPSDRRKVVDHTSSRLRLLLSPTHSYSPFIAQYLEYTFGFNGHGQEAWRTNAPYNRSFFNKSSEPLAFVKTGQIVAKRDIASCHGDVVAFTDGSEVRADLIVSCSGYRLQLPFFAEESAPSTDPRTWYKYIFAEDPSIAFVGFARPIFGSIPGLAELQSRYVAQIFADKRALPPAAERVRVTGSDAAFWNHHFRFTSLRLRGLVDHFLYSNQLARLIGCYPRFWSLLFSNPRKWWWAVSSPWNGCQFWLNDEAHHRQIFATLARYRDNQTSEVYTLLLLAPVLPLIGLFSRMRVFFMEHSSRTSRQNPAPGRPSGLVADIEPAERAV